MCLSKPDNTEKEKHTRMQGCSVHVLIVAFHFLAGSDLNRTMCLLITHCFTQYLIGRRAVFTEKGSILLYVIMLFRSNYNSVPHSPLNDLKKKTSKKKPTKPKFPSSTSIRQFSGKYAGICSA